MFGLEHEDGHLGPVTDAAGHEHVRHRPGGQLRRSLGLLDLYTGAASEPGGSSKGVGPEREAWSRTGVPIDRIFELQVPRKSLRGAPSDGVSRTANCKIVGEDEDVLDRAPFETGSGKLLLSLTFSHFRREGFRSRRKSFASSLSGTSAKS